MKTIIKKSALATGLFLYSLFAFADGGLTFTPVANDITMQFLGVLFGNLGPISGGGGVFAGPIAIFNGVVLTFGGIVLSYMWTLGMVRSAHSGSVLGDASAQVGYPIKTAVGAALVAPMFNSFSLIQVIAATIIASGIGAGDKLWSSYVNNQTDTMAQLSLQSINTPARGYGYELFKIVACQEFGDYMANNLPKELLPDWMGKLKDVVNRGYQMTGSKAVASQKTIDTAKFTTTVYNSGFNRCGTTSFSKLEEISWPKSTGKFTNPSDLASKGIAFGSFNAYAQNAQKKLETTLRGYAAQIASGQTVDGAKIDAAIDTYIKEYRDEVLGAIQKSGTIDSIAKNAADGGWASIATYYTTFTTLQTAISKAIQNVPTAQSYPGWLKGMDGEGASGKAAQKMIDAISDTMAGTYGGGANLSSWKNLQSSEAEKTMKDKKQGTSLGDAWDQSDMDIGKTMQIYIRDNLYSDQGFDGSANGITQAKAMGEKLFTFVGAYTIGALVLQVISSFAAGPAVALHTLSTLIFTVALPPAFFLSYAVPMLPYLICLGIVFNFLVLAIEAIILAQLWGLSLMLPGGDSILGSSKQGTFMILNLALRPMLTVLGFIASIAILSLASQWLSATFNDVFASMMTGANWFSQLIGIIANWTLYGAALFLVIQKSVGLCASVPDKTLQWLTGQASTSAQNEGAAFGGAAAAGAGAAIGSKAAGGFNSLNDYGMKLGKDIGGSGSAAAGSAASFLGDKMKEFASGVDTEGSVAEGANQEEEPQTFSEVSARNQYSQGEGAEMADALPDRNFADDIREKYNGTELPEEQGNSSSNFNNDHGSSGVSTNQMKSIAEKIGGETGQDTTNLSSRNDFKDFIKANSSVAIESSSGEYKPAMEVFNEVGAEYKANQGSINNGNQTVGGEEEQN